MNVVCIDSISVENHNFRIIRDDIFPFIGGGSKARKAVAYEKFLNENKEQKKDS